MSCGTHSRRCPIRQEFRRTISARRSAIPHRATTQKIYTHLLDQTHTQAVEGVAAIADEARRKAGKEYLLQLAKALIDEIRVWDPMKFGDCNEYMEEIQSIGGRLEPHTDAAALGSCLRDVPRVLRTRSFR